ncbi:Alpha/Beta hydrolase protein [Gorgonomyces haynaldii]|nr:Alpha/Beta hydrolase protein [Gorgonomyces haynaldii]
MLFTTLLASPCLAVNENDVTRLYRTAIKPYYDSGTFGTFKGRDGIPISYRAGNTKYQTAIVIAPGKSLQKALYSEFIYDLKSVPVAVYVMDHRGQGDSGRLTQNRNITHVKQFQDYVDDYATFVKQVVRPKHLLVIGFGESMGGLITAAFSTQNPGYLIGSILASPMMDINTSPLPRATLATAAAQAVAAGQGEAYATGQGPFQNATLEKSVSSQSPARIEVFNTINTERASGQGGGVSFGWLATSLQFAEQFQNKSLIMPLPVKMFTPNKDTVVDVAAEKKAFGVPRKQASLDHGEGSL